MKKDNIKGINDKSTIGKSWMFSDVPFSDVVEINNIKFNQKNELEIIGIQKDKEIKVIDYNINNNKGKDLFNLKIDDNKENKEANNININNNDEMLENNKNNNLVLNQKRERVKDNNNKENHNKINKINNTNYEFNNNSDDENDNFFLGDDEDCFFDFDN